MSIGGLLAQADRASNIDGSLVRVVVWFRPDHSVLVTSERYEGDAWVVLDRVSAGTVRTALKFVEQDNESGGNPFEGTPPRAPEPEIGFDPFKEEGKTRASKPRVSPSTAKKVEVPDDFVFAKVEIADVEVRPPRFGAKPESKEKNGTALRVPSLRPPSSAPPVKTSGPRLMAPPRIKRSEE
jgi:hypothetical protein